MAPLLTGDWNWPLELLSMRIELEPAYVLHARAYRETSLLVEAFTERYGRVGLLARGVRSARGQPQRALLQPLQPVLLSWAGRGELPLLRGAEAGAQPMRLAGEAVLAGLYANELLLRLLPREDPHPALFRRYAVLLSELATAPPRGAPARPASGVSDAPLRAGDDADGAAGVAGTGGVRAGAPASSGAAAPLAWPLRRFERDLLDELGYALVLTHDADGAPLQPALRYRYDPDLGPVPLGSASAGTGVSGQALLALAEDATPDRAALSELRRMMRRVLLERLGGRELSAWRTWPRLGGD